MIFKWKKMGKVLDPSLIKGLPWLKEFAQAPATLIFEKFVRVYFSSRPPRDSNNQYVSYTGFVDLDRENLKKIVNIGEMPVLPLGEIGSFDEFGVYPFSVIREGSSVIAYYGGWTRSESVPYNVCIGKAISNDEGRTFNKIGAGPILSFSLKEPMTISGPKIRRFNDIWCLWYIAGTSWKISNGRPESIFKIRFATSLDGVTWNRSGKTVIPDILGPDECQASPDVSFFDGKFHMFFSYKYGSDFRKNNRGYRIGYAYSSDHINWIRNDNYAGMALTQLDEWDGQENAYPHLFELDGERYMLYLGNEVGKYGFGIAHFDGYE
jgi:hypothetical protein